MIYLTRSDLFAAVSGTFRRNIVPFEKEFADFIGTRHAIATSYGRTALYLGLCGIGCVGREVILPDFTCAVVRQAVANAGAIPRFVKVDIDTLCFNRDDLLSKVNHNTLAIVVTHYFGGVALDIEEMRCFCSDRGLYLIEDCAHSLGAAMNGKSVGATGDFSIFSFTKSTVNFGGGVLVTSDDGLASRCRKVLSEKRKGIKRRILDFPVVVAYGLAQIIEKKNYDRVGPDRSWLMQIPELILGVRNRAVSILKLFRFNGRTPVRTGTGTGNGMVTEPIFGVPACYDHDIVMPGMVASVARSQLPRLKEMTLKRESVWRMLRDLPYLYGINVPKANGVRPAYNFLVLVNGNVDPEETIERAREKGVYLRPSWPLRQGPWSGQDSGSYRKLGKNVLIWNISPDVTDPEIDRLKAVLNNVILS